MGRPATWLVTGGAGFIGSTFVLAEAARGTRIVNLDALTYAGRRENLAGIDPTLHTFVHGDVCDRALVDRLFADYEPDAVVHLAAESHVDRSIADAAAFIRTNVLGTHVLLEAATRWWSDSRDRSRAAFRFVHVSTDEVYGSLGPDDPPANEASPYRPNSPYAASKAASDHLARAWHRTHGLPLIITHSSNNYGPRQFPEKLVPLMLSCAIQRRPLPVYGDGGNVRDWLHVADHADALGLVTRAGVSGETYDIAGGASMTNLALVTRLCDLVDELRPDGPPRRELISFVADRLGHDRRYAIDDGKIRRELGWTPRHDFDAGLRATARWYLEHPERLARPEGRR